MPPPSKPATQGSASQAEKLSILKAMLGPEALARVREGQPDIQPHAVSDSVEVDSDRATWHRNKLLERLRKHPTGSRGTATSTGDERETADRLRKQSIIETGESRHGREAGHASLDAKLAKISDVSRLGQEHPAIIARVMKSLSRDERVEALKSLPGPVARSIVRRLR